MDGGTKIHAYLMKLLYSALTIGFGISALLLIISFTPDSEGLPPEVSESIALLVSYIQPWSIIIDFATLFQVLLASLFFEVALLIARVFFWVYKHIFSMKT